MFCRGARKLLILALVFQSLGSLHSFAANENQELKEIKMSEYVCTNGDKVFGQLDCDTVRKHSVERLKKNIKNVIGHYYDGSIVEINDQAGFCFAVDKNEQQIKVAGPVCNIADPKGDQGLGEESKNWKGQSCGDSASGDAKDPRQGHWILGLRPQVWQKHYEEVRDEIQSGTVSLHTSDSEGTQPCSNYALAIQQLVLGKSLASEKSNGIQKLQNEISVLYKKTENPLNTNEAEGCLMEDDVASDDGSGSKEAKNTIERNFASAVTGIDREKKHIHQSSCALAHTRRFIEYLFNRLAVCEVMMRANKTFYENYFSLDEFYKELDQSVIQKCTKSASKKAKKACLGGFLNIINPSCAKKVAKNEYNKCVGNRAPAFFKNTFKAQLPVKESLAPYDKFEGIKSCAALSMIPFFTRRKKANRKQGRTQKKILKRSMVAVLILILLMSLLVGNSIFANDGGFLTDAQSIAVGGGVLAMGYFLMFPLGSIIGVVAIVLDLLGIGGGKGSSPSPQPVVCLDTGQFPEGKPRCKTKDSRCRETALAKCASSAGFGGPSSSLNDLAEAGTSSLEAAEKLISSGNALSTVETPSTDILADSAVEAVEYDSKKNTKNGILSSLESLNPFANSKGNFQKSNEPHGAELSEDSRSISKFSNLKDLKKEANLEKSTQEFDSTYKDSGSTAYSDEKTNHSSDSSDQEISQDSSRNIASSGTSPEDVYFQKNSGLSLFKIINKRYYKWSAL